MKVAPSCGLCSKTQRNSDAICLIKKDAWAEALESDYYGKANNENGKMPLYLGQHLLVPPCGI